jgi:hypothetical protein
MAISGEGEAAPKRAAGAAEAARQPQGAATNFVPRQMNPILLETDTYDDQSTDPQVQPTPRGL